MHYAYAMHALCTQYVTHRHMIMLLYMAYSLRDIMYDHMHILNMNNTYPLTFNMYS